MARAMVVAGGCGAPLHAAFSKPSARLEEVPEGLPVVAGEALAALDGVVQGAPVAVRVVVRVVGGLADALALFATLVEVVGEVDPAEAVLLVASRRLCSRG